MHTEFLTNLPASALLILLAIMLFAGLIHGTLGLGFPMIATPLLCLLVDVRTAILITLLPTVAVNLASIIRGGNWRLSFARFWPLPLYALVGGLLGTSLITQGDPAPYKLALALLILLYLATQLINNSEPLFSRNHPSIAMLVAGLLAGIAAGATNVMVPILIIYTLSLGLQPTVIVQVFNMTFLAGKLAQITVFGIHGDLHIQWLQKTAPFAAAALLALFAGMLIRDRIPTQRFRQIIKALLAGIAITLIVQYTHSVTS